MSAVKDGLPAKEHWLQHKQILVIGQGAVHCKKILIYYDPK